MASLNSLFSALRCSVASATDLSSALMPASRAASSSFRVSMLPSISLIAFSESEIESSRPFRLSSVSSNCASQYSFLLSSPCCSFLRMATISSIILMICSKPAVLPLRAKAIKSNSGRFDFLAAAWRSSRARAFCKEAETLTCTKLALALGKVFLNNSKASSSFKTLMVSASASSSSDLVFFTSSHSLVLVSQPASSSFLNFSSSPSASCVSTKSLFMEVMATPRSPMRAISSSTCPCKALSSFFLAAMSPS
mmetsp:Transcript_44553/g.111935  ORF Transcript_44553/g.111935 Transcript_44553/m.111935 type:complete len:252 (-) Transcript_44553:757-1512(-)